jgi:hypothetical protein
VVVVVADRNNLAVDRMPVVLAAVDNRTKMNKNL